MKSVPERYRETTSAQSGIQVTRSRNSAEPDHQPESHMDASFSGDNSEMQRSLSTEKSRKYHNIKDMYFLFVNIYLCKIQLQK